MKIEMIFLIVRKIHVMKFYSFNIDNTSNKYIKRWFIYFILFPQIVKKDDFLSLDIDKFMELLRSDDLNVSSEQIVFEAVKRWLAYNHILPQDALDLLIEIVRLPLLPAEVNFH